MLNFGILAQKSKVFNRPRLHSKDPPPPAIMLEDIRGGVVLYARPIGGVVLYARPIGGVVLYARPIEGVVLYARPIGGVVLYARPIEGVVLYARPIEGVVLYARPIGQSLNCGSFLTAYTAKR